MKERLLNPLVRIRGAQWVIFAGTVIICGIGFGAAMVANSFPGISCALCEHVTAAWHARILNNANVLGLSQLYTETLYARKILKVFLRTGFGQGIEHISSAEIKRWHDEAREMETRCTVPDWRRLSNLLGSRAGEPEDPAELMSQAAGDR
jgi:hypothetical protein